MDTKTETEKTTKANVPPITLEQFLAGTQKAYERGMEGWKRANADVCTAAYADDAITLHSSLNMVIGKPAITGFYAKMLSEGTRILGADCAYKDIWVSGRYVYSVDKNVSTARTSLIKQVLLVYVKSLTVWKIQPDGSLKIKVDSSNFDKLPDTAPVINSKGVIAEKDCFHCPENNRQIADASKETLNKIRQLEKEFHAEYLAKNLDAISSYYTPQAILLPDEADFIRGREQIRALEAATLRQYDIQSIGDQVICAEGTEEMVFVVNTYLIKVKDTTQDNQEITLPSKGVHVWQKQPDGSWKILIAIFNRNAQ